MHTNCGAFDIVMRSVLDKVIEPLHCLQILITLSLCLSGAHSYAVPCSSYADYKNCTNKEIINISSRALMNSGIY